MISLNTWCMDCEIRKYYWETRKEWIDWKNCPYVCEYATMFRKLARGEEQ